MERILEEITYKFGASGSEDEIMDYIRKKVHKNWSIKSDTFGNLYVYRNKDAKISVLTSIDETSFFISGEQKGFFKFKMLGDYPAVNLIDREVLFKDRKIGIIRNINEKESPEIGDLGVEMLDEKKPFIGEPFIIKPRFYKNKNSLFSTNLDSRAGAAFCLKFLLNKKISSNLKFVFLSRTKMGERSYYTAGKMEKSEIFVILKTSACKDGIEIGKGPVIGVFSRNYVLPLEFKNKVLDMLKKSRLKFQLKASEEISYYPLYLKSSGVRKILEISLPLKYHKSIYKLINKKDVLILDKLFENFIKNL